MTASEFIAAVQDVGGELYFEDTSLKIRTPKGALSAELRAFWPAIKPDVARFVVAGWEARERWQQYVAAHNKDAHCTDCGCETTIWEWDDFEGALCYWCAKAMLMGEDEPDPVIAEMLVRIAAVHKHRVPARHPDPDDW